MIKLDGVIAMKHQQFAMPFVRGQSGNPRGRIPTPVERLFVEQLNIVAQEDVRVPIEEPKKKAAIPSSNPALELRGVAEAWELRPVSGSQNNRAVPLKIC
jgi:hypothetical protein